MIRAPPIPRNISLGTTANKISYVGRPIECDSCERKGHIARDCPDRGLLFKCCQLGHVSHNCPNPPDAWGSNSAAPADGSSVDLRDNELNELQSQSQSVLAGLSNDVPSDDESSSSESEDEALDTADLMKAASWIIVMKAIMTVMLGNKATKIWRVMN